MEIKVKRVGTTKGTVGFLAEGFRNGALRLVEAELKSNGNHGLWLQGDGISQFLAAYNQYGLSKLDGDFQKYAPCDSYIDRGPEWTDAAWETLRRIAVAWCDECNKALDEEQPVNIRTVRVAPCE